MTQKKADNFFKISNSSNTQHDLNNIEHKCNIEQRKSMCLTGVKEVNSFDTKEILVDTVLGGLLVKGEELHIEHLNLENGNVDINGKINAIIYSDKNLANKNVKSIVERIFR